MRAAVEEFELNTINAAKLDQPYTSQQEMIRDTLAVVDYHLFVYYRHHQWLGPDNDMRNMLGLMVSREEFEHNLSGQGSGALSMVAEAGERETLRNSRDILASRLKHTPADAFPVMELVGRFELTMFKWLSFMLIYASQTDDRYEKMCAYLQDDVLKKHPTPMLCIHLFSEALESPESYLSQFSKTTVFGSLFDRSAQEGVLLVRQEVLDYLTGNPPMIGSGMRLFSGTPDAIMQTRFETAKALDVAMNTGEKRAILLSGPAGCGKCFQIQHLCTRRGEACLFADMDALDHSPAAVADAAFLARLFGAYLCLYHLDGQTQDGNITVPPALMIDAVRHLHITKDALFLLSRQAIHPSLGILAVDVVMEPTTENQRAELFESCLEHMNKEPDVDAFELASKFCFEPKQIVGACYQAAGMASIHGKPVDAPLIHRCCYRQVMSKLDELASPVKPNFTWDDVVMPPQQKKLLQHACSYVKYRHRVYQDWGFDQRISYGRGLSVLFAGVPGTGKTMSAQVMANQLNMEMYKINISQIVSKYIGETEKNLQAVFTEAKKANCILFFDECDALFGKRSEVKDAHDRNANVEVAYLLQQIEEHDGVCVLATNLLQNIDEAFMRRITYVVRFPFPDAQARKEIYLRTIPKQTPVEDDIDWDFIAEKFELSGGHIKNIVLSAAFSAAEEDCPISMRHMLNAAVGEMKKNDIVVVREELREYSDLLDI